MTGTRIVPPREAMAWTDDAACIGTDPDSWFPAGETTVTDLDNIDKLRGICNDCPVITPCLEFALRTGQPEGIWAGTTPKERRRIREQRRRGRPHSHMHPDLTQQTLTLNTR